MTAVAAGRQGPGSAGVETFPEEKRYAGAGWYRAPLQLYFFSVETLAALLRRNGFARSQNLPARDGSFLEPLSSHPMDVGEAERRGTLLRLGPGESLSHEMAATAYTGRQRVRAVGLDGRVERTSDL
ncbi:MAG TPA: hypothetical protein VGM69_06635 [Chloroflexota bacterium]